MSDGAGHVTAQTLPKLYKRCLSWRGARAYHPYRRHREHQRPWRTVAADLV